MENFRFRKSPFSIDFIEDFNEKTDEKISRKICFETYFFAALIVRVDGPRILRAWRTIA